MTCGYWLVGEHASQHHGNFGGKMNSQDLNKQREREQRSVHVTFICFTACTDTPPVHLITLLISHMSITITMNNNNNNNSVIATYMNQRSAKGQPTFSAHDSHKMRLRRTIEELSTKDCGLKTESLETFAKTRVQ